MKGIFAICKNIFVTALGLICSMENNNKVRFATDVLALAYYWYGPRKGQPKRDVGTFILIWDVPIHKKCLKRNMEMSDQETTPPENVIKGPWSVKSGREVKLPDKDIIALQQDMQFAGELSSEFDCADDTYDGRERY